MPVVAPTVAMALLPLLHVPPGDELLNVVVLPWHTGPDPDMGVAGGTTVTVADVKHPPGVVNLITLVPGETPVTTPALLIVATVVVTLLHVPPPALVLVSVVVLPWHTVVVPVIGASGFTVMFTVLVQPPVVV